MKPFTRQLWNSQCLFYQAVSDCCLKWLGILKPPSQNTGGKFILFCIQHKKLSIKLLNIAVKIYCISFVKSKTLNISVNPLIPSFGSFIVWSRSWPLKKNIWNTIWNGSSKVKIFFYSATVTQFVNNWQMYSKKWINQLFWEKRLSKKIFFSKKRIESSHPQVSSQCSD